MWGNASETNLQPLKCLINRAVRKMTFTPFGRIDLAPLYECLNILDVDQVKYLGTSKFLYKLKTIILPTKIGHYFEVLSNAPNHNYLLRNRERSGSQITPRLVSGQNSIQYRGEKIWNEIPLAIRNCDSLKKFKKVLKISLLESGT